MKKGIGIAALWLGAAASAYGQGSMRERHEDCEYSWGAGTPEYVDCMETFARGLDEMRQRNEAWRRKQEPERNGLWEELYDAGRKRAIENVMPDSSQCRLINDTVICRD